MKTNDQVVAFLYELMRDHLPVGVVNRLVEESTCFEGEEFELTDGYLAMKAKAVSEALHRRRIPPPEGKKGWMCWEEPAGILCACGEVHPPRDMQNHLHGCAEGRDHYRTMVTRIGGGKD